MPRRLAAPSPPLEDDEIRLEPLAQADAAELFPLLADPDIRRFTRVPEGADEPWTAGWIARYEAGISDGTRIAFAVRGRDGAFLGWAGIVELELDHGEGEIGYLTAPAARGRGIAGRAVELLTRWGFDELGLERLELRIDSANAPSQKVAERAGYRLEGVLRNVHFKDGIRSDVGVWSRLCQD